VWTGIDGLDASLERLVDHARGVYGDGFIGAHLQGSFALGGADAESDCDFIVVTAKPTDNEQLERLRAFHGALPHNDGYWEKHLEGSYAPADELVDIRQLGRAWPYVDHGSDKVILDPHCDTEVTRWILHHHGVTLAGPNPRTLVPEVPAGMMRAAARRSLDTATQTWRSGYPWDAWSQRYAVVTMPRLFRTLTAGDVVSKSDGVHWALQVLDARWHPLLTTALARRGQRPWGGAIDSDLALRTEEFIVYVGDLASGTFT